MTLMKTTQCQAVFAWFRREWLWVLAFLVGSGIRLWQFPSQVLADDEWHAIRTACIKSFVEILSDFSVSAAIPLAFWHKVMFATVGLSEVSIRLPLLVTGLASLVVLPWVARRHVGAETCRVFAVFLAISPLLIYYSRYARPYSISLLLSFVGLVAFYRWWTGGLRSWAALFTVCTVLSTYFHLTALFTMAAPFAFGVADLLLRRRVEERRPTLLALIVTGASCGLGLALVLAVPVAHDWGAIAHRAGTSSVGLDTLVHSMALFAGTGHLLVAALFTAVVILGLVALWQRDARFTILLLWSCFVAVIGSWLSMAAAVHVPIVFARYTLVLLPVLLLLAAAGLGRIASAVKNRAGSVWAAAVPVVCLVALFAQGPLPATYARPNNWTNHAIYQYSYDPQGPFSYAHDLRPLRISKFYRQLAEQPQGSLVIVEAPFFYEWHNSPYAFFQEVHGQHVRAGLLGFQCHQKRAFSLPQQGRHRLRISTIVNISRPETLAAAEADYLVLHKNLRKELPRKAYQIARVPNSNIPLESSIGECVSAFRELYGPEIFEDQDIFVFALR